MKSIQAISQQIAAMASQVEQLKNPHHHLRLSVLWIPRTQVVLIPSEPDNKELTLEEFRVLRQLVSWMVDQLRLRPQKKSKLAITYTISATPAVKLGVDFSTGSIVDQTGRAVCSLDEFMHSYVDSGIWWKTEPAALAEYLGGYVDERAAPAIPAAAEPEDLDLPWM